MSKLCIKNNSKHFLLLMGLIVVLMGILVPTTNIWAADCPTGSVWISNISPPNYGSCVTDNPQIRQQVDQVNAQNTKDSGLGGWIWKKFAQGVGYTLITLSSLALLLCGWLFDLVIQYTIIDMAKNLGGGPGGIGDAITLAWATLRDIANMCFIFILLYAAFKTMFDSNFGNFQTTVKNIIIVALLINFSLFFSKVVIDASNIVAIGFYNSITNQSQSLLPNQSSGISTGYMNMLGLQTFYDAKMLDNLEGGPTQIITIGVMSSIFMLITAVILLIAGIMFAARFVILIFLMILSPLALIAYIIPGMKGQFTKWREALVDQSFFAPLYFALTWVVFKLGNSLITAIQSSSSNPAAGSWADLTTNPQGVVTLILNYVLIMGFSIAALIFAKQMATKTAGFSAVAGGIAGGTAWGFRQAVGKPSRWIMESKALREASEKGGVGGALARGVSWTAYRGAKGSFDVRGIEKTKLGKAMGAVGGKEVFSKLGKAGGEGGAIKARQKYLEDKEKAKSEESKARYGESERAKYGREELEEGKRKKDEQYKDAVAKERERATEELKKAKMDYEKLRDSKIEYSGKADEMRKAEETRDKASKKLEDINKNRYQFPEEIRNLQAEATKLGEAAKAIKETYKDRQMAYAERLSGSVLASMRGLKAASQKIRSVVQGKDKKSAKQMIKEWAKTEDLKVKIGDEEENPEEEAETPAGGEETPKSEVPK